VPKLDLPLRFTDRIEDRVALSFYRTLFEAPATLLAVKHSFFFNETYGEAPQDRAILPLIARPDLRAEVERHLDDEVRHAKLWRDYLEARGELPDESEELPFGDFVGMLRAARWMPSPERLQETRPLDNDELMAFFAILHVVETQAVRQMLLFRTALSEQGDHALGGLIKGILQDEGRHMAYTRRALYTVGATAGSAGKGRAEHLERLAFRAFLRLRGGDMQKLLTWTFAHDGERLSRAARIRLKGLSAIVRRFPTRVPAPDGTLHLDASLPLPSPNKRAAA
jgi:hypothetical protein